MNWGSFKHKGNTASDPKQICFMGEVNYGFTEYLDAGVFCDFFRVKHYTEISEGNVYLKSYYNCFDYGLNANFHIFPLFLDPSFSIVDVYVTPKIGLRTICDKQVDYLSTGLYYSIGAGIGLNISKGFGVLFEYNYAGSNNVLRYGINIRF